VRLEQARDGVAEDRVAPAGDGDRARRVGAHELDVDALADGRLRASVAAARAQDGRELLVEHRGSQAQVDEAGACHVGGSDDVAVRESGHEPLGDGAR
jgi:hypothetical protein